MKMYKESVRVVLEKKKTGSKLQWMGQFQGGKIKLKIDLLRNKLIMVSQLIISRITKPTTTIKEEVEPMLKETAMFVVNGTRCNVNV